MRRHLRLLELGGEDHHDVPDWLLLQGLQGADHDRRPVERTRGWRPRKWPRGRHYGHGSLGREQGPELPGSAETQHLDGPCHPTVRQQLGVAAMECEGVATLRKTVSARTSAWVGSRSGGRGFRAATNPCAPGPTRRFPLRHHPSRAGPGSGGGQNEKVRPLLVALLLALAVLGAGCGVSIHLGPPRTNPKCRSGVVCIVHNGPTTTTTHVTIP